MQMCQICGQMPAIVKGKDSSGEEKLYCYSCAAKNNIPLTPENCIAPPFPMPSDPAAFSAAIENMFKSMGFDGAAVEICGGLSKMDINELTEKLQESLGENFPQLMEDDMVDMDNDMPEEGAPDNNAPKKQHRGFIFGIDPSKIGISPDMQSPFGDEKKSILKKYAVNLTDRAKKGLIPPVIGREDEIRRTIEILNRKEKNNPVLIGAPGVGKTAIANGVATKIANKQVPEKLFNAQLWQIDLTSLISGTQFRGQFEARMEKLVKECAQNPDIILVMDEIHSLASLGASEGSPGAGNILKPALSRGEIQIIGTTTAD